jgi:anti-anti-sigma regulatory factor
MEYQDRAVDAAVHPLVAPSRLTSDQRLEFRRAALELLELGARVHANVIEIDLRDTIEVDASGLGVLVLLQKRARERGLRTRLLNGPRPILEMLQLTRLDSLFEFGAAD